MGIDMDIRNEPKYSFLDLHDLDEADKNEIAEILRLDTSVVSLKLPWDIGEKEYETSLEIVENIPEDTSAQWQHYGVPEEMGYETCDVQSTPMMTTAMTSGHPYASHQMIYNVGDFSSMGHPYNSGAADPNTYQYIQRIPFPPPQAMYSSSQPEIINQPPSRDNDRRGLRNNRGGKRSDLYNRQMNSNNEIPTGYIVQGQPQYGQLLPMCHTSSGMYPVPAQSHPAAGTPIFIQSSPGSYSQGPQMSHNNHPSYSHHHSSYVPHSHSSSTTKYQRNSTGLTTYYNQESPKHYPKHQEKRIIQHQDPQHPPFRQTSSNNTSNNNNNNNNDVESPKINHNKRMIVNNTNANVDTKNNSMTSRQLDNKKATINHVKPEVVDVTKIKDDNNENKRKKKEVVVAPSNDNNNTTPVVKDKPVIQEKEVPIVREEKTLVVKTPTEVSAKSVKVSENTFEHNEVSLPVKNVQEPIVKTVENSTIVVTTTISSTTNVSTTQAPPSTKTSWAHVLKKPGPPVDVKSPTPIPKLPVACVRPISFTSPPVESVTTKTSATETAPRNDNATVTANRTSIGSATKNTENSKWSEKKNSIETSQNKLKDPAVLKMGELLLKYQMDKQTVSLLPRGLTNRSNYCYINSILQALLACPPFYNLLMALPYPRNSMENSSTPLIDNMVRFAREFNPLSESARMPRKDKSQKRGEETAVDVQYGVAFEPSYVYTMLKNTSCAGVFSVEGRQEDAEEFLSCLLNGISDEMLELMKLVNSESNDTTANPTVSNVNFSNAEEEWKVMGPKNKGSITRCTEFGRTPLSDIFRGQLRSRVSRTGDETTDNVQPFFTLQLDIEKAESVAAALEILVGKDQVEGMTCSKTKQQIEAWKQVLLEDLPVILILHLKWFDYKLDGCSKIFKRVEFPIDLKLDTKLLSPNLAKKLSRKQKQYKLFAVTYHDGKEASKGHYVTDAFHVGYNAWVRYDDSSVKGIYEKDVLNPSPPRVPYLLYYRRCDTIGNNPPITTRTR